MRTTFFSVNKSEAEVRRAGMHIVRGDIDQELVDQLRKSAASTRRLADAFDELANNVEKIANQ